MKKSEVLDFGFKKKQKDGQTFYFNKDLNITLLPLNEPI